MMGATRADAMAMSLWEYESRLYHWNEAHDTGEVKPPSAEMTQRLLDRANADPRLTH